MSPNHYVRLIPRCTYTHAYSSHGSLAQANETKSSSSSLVCSDAELAENKAPQAISFVSKSEVDRHGKNLTIHQ